MTPPDDDDLAYPDDGPDDGSTAEPPKRRGGPPPASEKQLNFIRLLVDKVGLKDDELETLISDVTGKESLDDLDIGEASQMIDELQIKAKERNVDLDSQPKASDKQIGFIKSLKRRAHLTDAEFAELLSDVAGVEDLEEIGKRDASSLIDELQARAKGEGGSKSGGSKSGGSKSGGKKKAASKKKAAPKASGGDRRGRHAPPPADAGPPAWDDDDVPF